MFETYLEGQTVDPRLRPRRFVATVLAVTAVAVGLSTFFVAEKMGITPVSAPHIEHVLVMQVGVQPPPQARVPDRPKSSKPPAQSQPDNPAIVPAKRDDDPDPSDFMESPRRTQVDDEGGSERGAHDGIGDPLSPTSTPPCFGPLCEVGKPPKTPIFTPPPPEDEDEEVAKPMAWMKARKIFLVDPSQDDLNKTPTGRGARRSGTVAVTFCVDKGGKVVHAKIAKSFGDHEVDHLCRQAVRRWRFRSALLGGSAKRTCSEAVFEIVFD